MRALDTLVVFAIALTGPACSTSAAVTLTGVGQSPGASVSSGLATVPVGVVLGLRVNSRSSGVVTAAVDDTTLATVAPTAQDNEVVVIGLATGQTTLHLFVNNAEALELSVQVGGPAP